MVIYEDIYNMKELLAMIEFLLRDESTIVGISTVYKGEEVEKYLLSYKY